MTDEQKTKVHHVAVALREAGIHVTAMSATVNFKGEDNPPQIASLDLMGPRDTLAELGRALDKRSGG